MTLTLTQPDENTDGSALASADEALCYCAGLAMAKGDTALLAIIKEGQRRIRRRTNPEMFDSAGAYR